MCEESTFFAKHQEKQQRCLRHLRARDKRNCDGDGYQTRSEKCLDGDSEVLSILLFNHQPALLFAELAMAISFLYANSIVDKKKRYELISNFCLL
jgi:hypothetical protein